MTQLTLRHLRHRCYETMREGDKSGRFLSHIKLTSSEWSDLDRETKDEKHRFHKLIRSRDFSIFRVKIS